MARAQQRHVVAECGAEAARLEEVALHVDDHQRGSGGNEGEGVGLRVDLQCLLLGNEPAEAHNSSGSGQ